MLHRLGAMDRWDLVLWDAVKHPGDFGSNLAARSALANGANASMVCPNGRTALWTAVRNSKADTVKLLLGNGATATDLGNAPALFTLCVNRLDVRSLQYLFTSGALDTVDEECFHRAMNKIAHPVCEYGESSVDDALHIMRMCVHYAVIRGYELSRLINTPDMFFRTRTLLHQAATSACIYLRVPLVQMLVDYDADVFSRDRDGHTAEDLARSQPNCTAIDDEVIGILKKERLRTMEVEAFAMGSHPRLGRTSVVDTLDADNLRVICELIRKRGRAQAFTPIG